MLVRQWISEIAGEDFVTFESLRHLIDVRAESVGIEVSESEIRVVLEKLIASGEIATCQYLAESQSYGATVYDNSNIYWYFFRAANEIALGASSTTDSG